MISEEFYIETAVHQLNKKGEELCGDNVEIYQDADRLIAVLADGLGSGVKANILATLTTKIAVTMLKHNSSIEETIDTIMNTLPVCQVRQIAYSTFGILQIDQHYRCVMIEYDTPPYFFVRQNQILQMEKKAVRYGEKIVKFSEVQLQEGDSLTMVSDGVIHAGIGNVLNHGWEWEHVAAFLERQTHPSSELMNKRLVDACYQLYAGKPGDDTTAVTLMLRRPEVIHIFAGPPEQKEKDAPFVKEYMAQKGKKIVCGGTAANIIARETRKKLETSLDYVDPEIPPTATIEGIELVTEGVLTLQKTINLLNDYYKRGIELKEAAKDGASLLLRLLLHDSTHVKIWVGKAVNPAHQNPDFPIDLSIKLNVIQQLKSSLEAVGKHVSLHYL